MTPYPRTVTTTRIMKITILLYSVDKIEDVILFEQNLRKEEDVWGWEIDDAYVQNVKNSFADPSFGDCISFLAYVDHKVVGRIDCSMIKSRFDGSTKAYLDWICVIKSYRHQGVAQRLLARLQEQLKDKNITTLVALTAANEEAQRFYRAIPNAQMHDIGIWIDI